MNDVVKIEVKESGLTETKAQELNVSFAVVLGATAELEVEGNAILEKDASEESCKEARECRLKMVKVRTSTAKVHKDLKASILLEGKAIDGLKNAQLMASTGIEEKLMDREKHFERIEEAKIKQLDEDRIAELRLYGCEVFPANIGAMDEAVYNGYRDSMKAADEAKQAADEEAEKARIAQVAADKKAKAEKEKEAKAERKRVIVENDRLKAIAEKLDAELAKRKKESDAIKADAKKAKDELEKVQADAKKKADDEAKEKADKEKREKNQAHRKRVNNGLLEELEKLGLNAQISREIITAIAQGKIANIQIQY